jgi:hypothetical protein
MFLVVKEAHWSRFMPLQSLTKALSFNFCAENAILKNFPKPYVERELVGKSTVDLPDISAHDRQI